MSDTMVVVFEAISISGMFVMTAILLLQLLVFSDEDLPVYILNFILADWLIAASIGLGILFDEGPGLALFFLFLVLGAFLVLRNKPPSWFGKRAFWLVSIPVMFVVSVDLTLAMLL